MKPEQISAEGLPDYKFKWSFLAPKYWLLWLWFAILWLVSRLPYRVFCFIARSVGLLFMLVGKERRVVAERNVELCYPELSEKERKHIVRESFAGAGMSLFESGYVWWPVKRHLDRTSIQGLEHIENARARGENILMFTCHNTPLEACFGPLANIIGGISVVFRVHNNACWEYVSGVGRLKYQFHMVPKKAIKFFISNMQKGKVSLIAPDQDFGPKRSLFVPFFNIPTASVPTVPDTARQANASVFFVEINRKPYQSCHVVIHPKLEKFPSGDNEADTALTNQITEDCIRRSPGDYLWHHRRFKTRPPGEPEVYPKKKKRKKR